MTARAYGDVADPVPDRSDRADVFRAVAALRSEMREMEDEMRRLTEDRTPRHDNVTSIRGERDGEHWRSEARRVREEVDQLMREYATVSHQRARAVREPTEPTQPGNETPWMKKMLMMMMLTELTREGWTT